MLVEPDAEVQGIEVLVSHPPEGIPRRETPLLFVHGAFAGAWCWAEHFLPWFAARGYDSYALSLRGHGGSAGHDDLHSFGIQDYVKDLASIVEDFDVPPVLVGHSMGGFVCMRYLEQAEAAGLVLMASVPPTGLTAPALSVALWNPALWRDISLIRAMIPAGRHPRR